MSCVHSDEHNLKFLRSGVTPRQVSCLEENQPPRQLDHTVQVQVFLWFQSLLAAPGFTVKWKEKGLCDSIPKTFFLIYWERLWKKKKKNSCSFNIPWDFQGVNHKKVCRLFSSQCLSTIWGFFRGFIDTVSQRITWCLSRTDWQKGTFGVRPGSAGLSWTSNLKLLTSGSDNDAPCFTKWERSGSKMHPGDRRLCPMWNKASAV